MAREPIKENNLKGEHIHEFFKTLSEKLGFIADESDDDRNDDELEDGEIQDEEDEEEEENARPSRFPWIIRLARAKSTTVRAAGPPRGI